MRHAPFALRPAGAADAPALGRLHAACWQETYAGIMPASVLATSTVETRTRLWRGILDPTTVSSTHVVVVEKHAEMVGFGASTRQRTAALAQHFEGEITALYVLRQAQRLGVGSAVLDALADQLSGRGWCGVALWVLRENDGARRFYEKRGGVLVGEREEFRAGGSLCEVAYGWRDLGALRDARLVGAHIDPI